MELIIKPTERCNFSCTFCSSTDIADSKEQLLDLDLVDRWLTRFTDVTTIIVNGGDPLMVKPEYYYRLIDILEKHGKTDVIISLTTNLWDFHIRPDKWVDLFNHPQIAVCTSFNYGETRRISKDRVFTEIDFVSVFNKFVELVGYKPEFIAVIDHSNLETALDTVRLAKRLDTKVKLNHAMASGDQEKPLPLADIYSVYLNVLKEDLHHYEHNTNQLIKHFNNMHTMCPLARDCDKGIRNFNPDGSYYSCGAFGDDRLAKIDLVDELASDTIATPLSNNILYETMHSGCYSCPMFGICNGCRKTIKDHRDHNIVEEHCVKMKAQSNDLIELSMGKIPYDDTYN